MTKKRNKCRWQTTGRLLHQGAFCFQQAFLVTSCVGQGPPHDSLETRSKIQRIRGFVVCMVVEHGGNRGDEGCHHHGAPHALASRNGYSRTTALDHSQALPPLNALPATPMQFQAIGPEDSIWPTVYKSLKDEIESSSYGAGVPPRCSGKLTYDSMQEDMSRRKMNDPELLQDYTIVRVDEEPTGSKPVEANNRKRIQYSVHRGRPEDLRVQPMDVFIERQVSKRVPLGQRLQSETGLTRTTTLLSAVNDWHTWIVLTTPAS